MSQHVQGNKAILTDTTKCIGCRECVLACKQRNKLEQDKPRRWSLDDGLSARNWTSIVERPGGDYVRKQCRHCLEPACVSVCPVGALSKSETGAVIYDGDKCMGCRYCMMACPYGIPRYDWDLAVPYVRKCILCDDQVKQGGSPACTEACPTGATIFGTRDELIVEARRRIEADPDRYVNHIWGEDEVGGTSVMMISNIDLSFLSYGTKLDSTPLPARTKTAMGAVPAVFAGMAATMTGLHWIIKRRMENHGAVPTVEEEGDNGNGGDA
ncbi:4Fe-4S dicluster domain-containing protein [bacterium]|nr:4Fe-4S dicluster domain-containing protein [bacterium]